MVALWFGDDTARRAGRLTLNPVPHIDPFGSIILPAMGALAGIPVIGWAKPVPVNPNQLRNPRRDMLAVSLAGPGHELPAHVRVGGGRARLYHPAFNGAFVVIAGLPLGVQIALSFAVVNLFLGVFNFLPIPPLDGAALLERVMPRALAARLGAIPAVRDPGALRARLLGRAARASVRSVPAPALRLHPAMRRDALSFARFFESLRARPLGAAALAWVAGRARAGRAAACGTG